MRDVPQIPITKAPTHSAKILLWDVETSSIDIHVRQYGLKVYNKYLNWKDIHRDWTMLGGSWMWLEDEVPRCVSVSSQNPFDDEFVVRRMHEILQQADVSVAHNGDNFDIKKFNTRALFYDLDPISHIHTIDTLKVAKKHFSFTSNSLGALAKTLKLEDKGQSPDWNKILSGCPEELAKMREYNRIDVLVLKQVYLKLRPWISNHHNLQPYSMVQDVIGKVIKCCKACGSLNIRKNGVYKTNSGNFTGKHKYKCNDCKHVFVDHERKNG
jgi:RNase_H superfamily